MFPVFQHGLPPLPYSLVLENHTDWWPMGQILMIDIFSLASTLASIVNIFLKLPTFKKLCEKKFLSFFKKRIGNSMYGI